MSEKVEILNGMPAKDDRVPVSKGGPDCQRELLKQAVFIDDQCEF